MQLGKNKEYAVIWPHQDPKDQTPNNEEGGYPSNPLKDLIFWDLSLGLRLLQSQNSLGPMEDGALFTLRGDLYEAVFVKPRKKDCILALKAVINNKKLSLGLRDHLIKLYLFYAPSTNNPSLFVKLNHQILNLLESRDSPFFTKKKDKALIAAFNDLISFLVKRYQFDNIFNFKKPGLSCILTAAILFSFEKSSSPDNLIGQQGQKLNFKKPWVNSQDLFDTLDVTVYNTTLWYIYILSYELTPVDCNLSVRPVHGYVDISLTSVEKFLKGLIMYLSPYDEIAKDVIEGPKLLLGQADGPSAKAREDDEASLMADIYKVAGGLHPSNPGKEKETPGLTDSNTVKIHSVRTYLADNINNFISYKYARYSISVQQNKKKTIEHHVHKYFMIYAAQTSLALVFNFKLSIVPISMFSYKSKVYGVGTHHSTIYLLYKPNKASGFSFKPGPSNPHPQLMCLEGFYLNAQVANNLIDFQSMVEGGFKPKTYLEALNMMSDLGKKLIGLFLKIKKLGHIPYSKDSLNKETPSALYSLSFFKKEALRLCKDLSNLREWGSFLGLYEIYNGFKFKLYFSPMYDFRGRYYYLSTVAPQGSYIFRYIYDFGVYTSDDLNTLNTIWGDAQFENVFLGVKASNEISSLLKKYKALGIPIWRQLLIWALYDLGRLDKRGLGATVTLLMFLNKGDELLETFYGRFQGDFKLFFSFKSNWKVGDCWEFMTVVNRLEAYKANKSEIRRFCRFEDFTASFAQNSLKILGCNNDEVLKLCNLKSEEAVWYDTYQHIIGWFFLGLPELEPEVRGYFTRSTLKRLIMTESYGAGTSCMVQDFFKGISSDQKSSFWGGSSNPLEGVVSCLFNKVKRTLNLFICFLKKELELNYLYNQSSSNLINWYLTKINSSAPSQGYILLEDGSQCNLIYFQKKKEPQRVEVPLNQPNVGPNKVALSHGSKPTKARITFLTKHHLRRESQLDIKKIKRALRANLTHACDAALAREVQLIVFKEIGIWPIAIHDSFGIDQLATLVLKKAAIKAVKKIYLKVDDGLACFGKIETIHWWSFFITL